MAWTAKLWYDKMLVGDEAISRQQKLSLLHVMSSAATVMGEYPMLAMEDGNTLTTRLSTPG